MSALLRSELRKFFTTRLWWVLLIALGVYMGGTAMLLAFAFTSTDATGQGAPASFDDPAALVTAVYGTANSLGYVFPVIIGALAVTSELRHHTLTPTYLATPARTRVLGAKLVSSLPLGLLYGIVGTAVSVGGGAAMLALRGHATFLTDPAVLESVGRSVLGLTIWILVGVGVGALVRNQVVAIVVVLVYTQLVEPILRSVLVSTPVARYLPGAAGDAIVGSSVYSAAGLGSLLPWWAGALLLAGYGLAAAGIASATTLRGDVA